MSPAAETTFTLDLTDYKERVGGRVEPGRYDFVVEDAELTRTKEKPDGTGNKQMINVYLRIEGGEGDGVTVIDRLLLEGRGQYRIVSLMQALGMPTPRKAFKLDTRLFIGKRVAADVDDGVPFQGRVKSEIQGYVRGASNSPSAPAAEETGDGLDGLTEFSAPSEPVAAAQPVPQEQPAPRVSVEHAATNGASVETAASVPVSQDVIDLSTIDL